jgi:hypothetical protein
MTKRRQIFEALKLDLLKINTSNGYMHDITQVISVLKSPGDVSVYPSVNLMAGDEEIHPDFEDRNLFACRIKMIILTHIETNYDLNSEGLNSAEAESWIEDYEKFMAAENADTGCTLCLMPGVENYYVSKIEPYSDWRDNRQTLEVTITVEYINLN